MLPWSTSSPPGSGQGEKDADIEQSPFVAKETDEMDHTPDDTGASLLSNEDGDITNARKRPPPSPGTISTPKKKIGRPRKPPPPPGTIIPPPKKRGRPRKPPPEPGTTPPPKKRGRPRKQTPGTATMDSQEHNVAAQMALLAKTTEDGNLNARKDPPPAVEPGTATIAPLATNANQKMPPRALGAPRGDFTATKASNSAATQDGNLDTRKDPPPELGAGIATGGPPAARALGAPEVDWIVANASTTLATKETTEMSTTTSPEPKRYHALRKSNAFIGPVIFLSWDDCFNYIDPLGGNVIEFQSFDNILDALEYTKSTTVSQKRPPEQEEPDQPSSPAQGNKKAKTATLPSDDEKEESDQPGSPTKGSKNASTDTLPPEDEENKEHIPKKLTKDEREKARRLEKQRQEEEKRKQNEKQNEIARFNIEKSWEDSYLLLAQYKEKNGHCNICESSAGTDLAKWMNSVFHEMHKFEECPTATHKHITTERYQRLLDLGVETPKMKRDRIWEENFQRLVRYELEHGDCNIVSSDGEDTDLAKWVTLMGHQMHQFEHDRAPAVMTRERYERLKNLGVSVLERAGRYVNVPLAAGVDYDTWWEQMFLELAAFKEEHGHTTIPREPPSMLLNFTKYQQKEYTKLRKGEKSKLTDDRIARLNGLGFELSAPKRRTFQDRALQWLEYKQKHGCDPPSGHTDGLGSWVQGIRRWYRLSKTGHKRGLSQEHFEHLDRWGFRWEIDDEEAKKNKSNGSFARVLKTWEERFAELIEFVNENGHARVRKLHEGGLGRWCQSQRQLYKKYIAGTDGTNGKMDAERVAKLQSVGFDFDPRRNQGKSG